MPKDATPFIDIAARAGRPRLDVLKRVEFTTTFVRPDTLAQLKAWSEFANSRGVILDRLVAFAIVNNFSPTKTLIELKNPGAATTPPPGPSKAKQAQSAATPTPVNRKA